MALKEFSKEFFSKRLRDLREDHDKKQKDIAELLFRDRSAYTRYENQGPEPSISSLFILANYYNTSIDYLVGRTDNPKPYK